MRVETGCSFGVWAGRGRGRLGGVPSDWSRGGGLLLGRGEEWRGPFNPQRRFELPGVYSGISGVVHFKHSFFRSIGHCH